MGDWDFSLPFSLVLWATDDTNMLSFAHLWPCDAHARLWYGWGEGRTGWRRVFEQCFANITCPLWRFLLICQLTWWAVSCKADKQDVTRDAQKLLNTETSGEAGEGSNAATYVRVMLSHRALTEIDNHANTANFFHIISGVIYFCLLR